MNSKAFSLALIVCSIVSVAQAQEVVRLYPGPAPGTEDWSHEEQEYYSPIFQNNVVTNVVNPTLTVYLPEESKATGTAVIIAPGGGFHALSIDSEGTQVAEWLAERGVAGFVLRYRLVPTGEDGVKDMMQKAAKPDEVWKAMADVAPFSGADGLAAVRHVRENASKYGVDPNRIGFMGFSAGGAVTTHVALHHDKASRPDFVAPIYAATRMIEDGPAPKGAPPMFIVAASDDGLDLAPDSVALYTKWLAAKRPVEMHLYAKGGHGFGMKTQNLPSDTWIERFGDWLEGQGLMEKKD